MLEEFKKFALRGNVVDLAVGVIIGAAFGAIVTSLVGDIIMPVVGAITGGLDFSNYYCAAVGKGAVWPLLCGREKAGCSPRLRSISDGGDKLLDHRFRSVHGDPRDQQVEKEGRRKARGAAGFRKTSHRDQRPPRATILSQIAPAYSFGG